MKDFSALIGPALAMLFIVRRGFKARRVKYNRLWVSPTIIAALALLTLSRGQPPGPLLLGLYAVAVAAGGALGWFTTKHVELTLDPQSETISSKPTPLGTIVMVSAFLLKFVLDFYMTGQVPNVAPGSQFAPRSTPPGLLWFANSMLLFASAQGLGRAWHMWNRTRPLVAEIERRRAAPLAPPPAPPTTP